LTNKPLFAAIADEFLAFNAFGCPAPTSGENCPTAFLVVAH
jgi:hypothetical protein